MSSYKKVEGKKDLLYYYFLEEGGSRIPRDEFYSLLYTWFRVLGYMGHPAIVENKLINHLKELDEKADKDKKEKE